jgi:hypothetical protein
MPRVAVFPRTKQRRDVISRRNEDNAVELRRFHSRFPHDIFLETFRSTDIPVQFNHATTAGSLMQSIHILSYQSKLRNALLELGQRAMTRVGFSLRDQLAAPRVPFPHQLWISPEGGRGREFFGIEPSPKPGLGFAKRGHSALGRNPGASQHSNAPRASQLLDHLRREITRLHCVPIKAGYCSFFVDPLRRAR